MRVSVSLVTIWSVVVKTAVEPSPLDARKVAGAACVGRWFGVAASGVSASSRAAAAVVTVVAACLFMPPGWCADQAQSEDKDNFFKRAAKVIGHDAKSGAKQAGHAFKQLGKDIGHGTSKTVKDVGRAMKDSAEKTGKAAKDTVK